MANEKKASGINLPNLTQNEQGIEINARQKDASAIHEHEQQSKKEAWANNVEEARKRCLETFAETSRRTAETNNKEHKKKDKAEWKWDNKLLAQESWKRFRIKERRKQHQVNPRRMP